MTTKERLGEWIKAGLISIGCVKKQELSELDRYVFDLVSEDILVIAYAGKIGNAKKALEMLNMASIIDGQEKVRSLTVAEMCERLDLPKRTAEVAERLQHLYGVPPRNIAGLLLNGGYNWPFISRLP